VILAQLPLVTLDVAQLLNREILKGMFKRPTGAEAKVGEEVGRKVGGRTENSAFPVEWLNYFWFVFSPA
jgi:hypothetical protein